MHVTLLKSMYVNSLFEMQNSINPLPSGNSQQRQAQKTSGTPALRPSANEHL